MVIKRVGILYHPMIERAQKVAKDIENFLVPKGVSVWTCSAWEPEKVQAQLDKTDLILTTGGDGTILRAVQVALPAQTPITGINLGKLGFMTELGADEAVGKLPDLIAGKGWIDERALLEVELPGEHEPDVKKFYALNDVVVARGAIARLIVIDVIIDSEPLTTYRADGIIVATATGSTGYSLAAGGPILHPRSEEMVLVPINPHLGLAYSMVLPPQAVVTLRVNTSHQATISVDGHINMPLSSGTVITVRQSANKTRFLRIRPENSFYRTLEQKLKRNREGEKNRKS